MCFWYTFTEYINDPSTQVSIFQFLLSSALNDGATLNSFRSLFYKIVIRFALVCSLHSIRIPDLGRAFVGNNLGVLKGVFRFCPKPKVVLL